MIPKDIQTILAHIREDDLPEGVTTQLDYVAVSGLRLFVYGVRVGSIFCHTSGVPQQRNCDGYEIEGLLREILTNIKERQQRARARLAEMNGGPVPRTFSEVALCHLPDDEISLVQSLIDEGMTSAYKNDAGFMIWSEANVEFCPVLSRILAAATTDYVLFDVDVEPDPDLEVYDA